LEKNYFHLQTQINELIKKTGSVENAVNFLESVMPNSASKEDISLFITFAVANYFRIKPEDLINEDRKLNALHRMVCYQLHKECLGLSIRKTGVIYKRKENAVMLGLRRMSEIIEKPTLEIEAYQCFIFVKAQVQNSIKYFEKK
jgi:chromosomal replication initiation ATPase DnaA